MGKVARGLAAWLVLLPAVAGAVELADGRLTLNGFGGWGTGLTRGNSYLMGSDNVSTQEVNVSLAFLARPSEALFVASQVEFKLFGQDEQEVELDWAFAQWRFSDALALRAGRGQLPFGLYSELMDVGTVRPFFTLPQGIYGPSKMGTEGYDGLGLTGTLEGGKGWDFEYDAYGGRLRLEEDEPFLAAGHLEGGEGEIDDALAFGTRLTVSPPLEGLRVLVSGYVGVIQDADTDEDADGDHGQVFGVVGPSVEYVDERWSARAEAFVLLEPERTVPALYAELGYFFLPRWQAAARYDFARILWPGYQGISTLLRHQDAAVGLNWWASEHFVMKGALHAVRGNRFAHHDAEGEGGLVQADQLHRDTLLFSLGAQFSF